MWLKTELGGFVQLSHVAQLIPGYRDGGGRGGQQEGLVRVVLASGIEQVLDYGFASEAEAGEAIRAVLTLARVYDRHHDLHAAITLQQALEGAKRLARTVTGAAASSSARSAAPEGASSFPPGPLTEAEIKRADATLADAADYARKVNEAAAAAATRGDGDVAAGGRILR